jgi:hypothetical protein
MDCSSPFGTTGCESTVLYLSGQSLLYWFRVSLLRLVSFLNFTDISSSPYFALSCPLVTGTTATAPVVILSGLWNAVSICQLIQSFSGIFLYSGSSPIYGAGDQYYRKAIYWVFRWMVPEAPRKTRDYYLKLSLGICTN